MTTIRATEGGWYYEQVLPYLSNRVSTARPYTQPGAPFKASAEHQADRVLTSFTDLGGGAYSATDASLKDLFGTTSQFINGHGNTILGAANEATRQVVEIQNRIASCWFPAVLRANIVTSIELIQSDFSVSVTTAEVVFRLCSNVSSAGPFTFLYQDVYPDTSQITNLVIAAHNGTINNSFQLAEKYPEQRSRYKLYDGGVYISSQNTILKPARHYYVFPSYVSLTDCCVPFASADNITAYLADRYKKATEQGQVNLWTGQAIPLSRAAIRLEKT